MRWNSSGKTSLPHETQPKQNAFAMHDCAAKCSLSNRAEVYEFRSESVGRIIMMKNRGIEGGRDLQPPAALMKSLACGRHRLVSANNVQ
jgi:hypothetical protein